MSNRAYNVRDGITNERMSFNMWHERALEEFFSGKMDYDEYYGRNHIGTQRFPVVVMEEATKVVKFDGNGSKQRIIADIEWAERNNYDTLEYDCG